ERHLTFEVEAVDRLDQPDRADLLDVFERLAAAGVAASKRPHQQEVAADQLLARARVAVLVVATEQFAVLTAARRRRRPGDAPCSWHALQLLQPDDDARVAGLVHAEGVDDRLQGAFERQLAGAGDAVTQRLADRALAQRADARADAVGTDLERHRHRPLR